MQKNDSMESNQEIAAKIARLPPHLQQELADYLDFLLTEKQKNSEYKLKQDWAGALEDVKEEYTSLGLQKKSMDWRENTDK